MRHARFRRTGWDSERRLKFTFLTVSVGLVKDTILWDLMPNSTMTNGAVAQRVQKVEGNTLQVNRGMEIRPIVVPSDAEVVNLVAGGKDDLKNGAHVFVPRWEKQGDGTWQERSLLSVAMDHAADVTQFSELER